MLDYQTLAYSSLNITKDIKLQILKVLAIIIITDSYHYQNLHHTKAISTTIAYV